MITTLVETVAHHTNMQWILLVERWLKAPLQLEDGTLTQRDCGSLTYAQLRIKTVWTNRWVMRSVSLDLLSRAGLTAERCA